MHTYFCIFLKQPDSRRVGLDASAARRQSRARLSPRPVESRLSSQTALASVALKKPGGGKESTERWSLFHETVIQKLAVLVIA